MNKYFTILCLFLNCQLFGQAQKGDNVINVKLFGAKSDGYFDNRPAFLAAIAALQSTTNSTQPHTLNKGILYIPADNGFYYLSDSIVITDNLSIEGDYSNYPNFQSRIMFAKNKPGIIIRNNPSSGSGAYYGHISNLEITKDDPYHDTTSFDGVWCNTRSDFENVYVHHFSGNGISINTKINGNANSSRIVNCHVGNNKESGLFMRGQESNNCYIELLHTIGNGKFGVEDSSFLGNNYINLHSESNGYRPGVTNVSCGASGSYWWCKKDNLNVKPGITNGWQDYWSGPNPGGAGNAVSNDWDSTKQYRATGAFRSQGTVQKSCIISSYTEGGQGPVYICAGCQWIGGDVGSGFQDSKMNFITSDNYRWDIRGDGLDVYSSYKGDPSTSLKWVSLERANGITVSTKIGSYSFNGDSTTMMASFYPTNLPAIKLMGFTYGSFPYTKFGWPSSSPVYRPIVNYSLAWRDRQDLNRYRSLFLSKGKPVGGSQGEGDWSLNTDGVDSTNIGWKYLNSTTPIAIKSGNFDLKTYTPTSSNDPVGKTGDQCSDSQYFYRKTATGWKRIALETF